MSRLGVTVVCGGVVWRAEVTTSVPFSAAAVTVSVAPLWVANHCVPVVYHCCCSRARVVLTTFKT